MTPHEWKPAPADRKKFDIDLAFGEAAENELVKLLGAGKKVEVKDQTRSCHRTGNVFVEFRYDGKPSGIATTEADYWAFKLYSDGRYILMQTWWLKELARLVWRRRGSVMGGDHNRAQGVLIPVKALVEYEPYKSNKNLGSTN